MGCDGGTIPKRDELVRTKKKPEQIARDVEIDAKWKHCALSQEPLRPPIMACELGRLYNKESILEYLLDKSIYDSAAHIRTLKDAHTLNLTENPAFKEDGPDKGDAYIDRQMAKYICPVVGLEMNGRYRFVYLLKCGCVFSERALKELQNEGCSKCGTLFTKDDVIVINGSDDDVDDLRARMKSRQLLAKQERKAKKKKLDSSGASDAEFVVSKKQKLSAPSASSSLSNGVTASQAKSGGVPSTSKSIAADPNASKTYKSLFTSSDKAKNQQQAHWITYNPFYN